MADPAFDIVTAGSGATATTAGGANTITFQYPAARASASYAGQGPALLGVRNSQAVYTEIADFSIAYGSTIVVTLGATVPPIAANSAVTLQLPLRDTSGEPTVYGTALPSALERAGL